MGRFLESGTVADVGGGGGFAGTPGVVTASADNPVTGIFGLGQKQWFFEDGTFTVPDGITSIRVRLWGGGGRAGGGFAIKTITALTPGASVAVTVGAAGSVTAAGGTSSFGAYVSATGGESNSSGTSYGGVGSGGDFNSQGGENASASSGGGGAAGIFGDGGDAPQLLNGINGNAGGGGSGTGKVGGNGISGPGGAQVQANGEPGIVTSLDFIATGGGGADQGNGINGGGGGGSGGSGGFPAGGAVGNLLPAAGLVIVEW